MRTLYKEVGSLHCLYSAKDTLKEEKSKRKEANLPQKLSPPDLPEHYINKYTNKFHLLDLL